VTSRLYSGLASLFHAAAIVACLVALVSFTLFALDQVSTASQAQQSELSVGTATAVASDSAPASAAKGHSSVRRTIDDASSDLGRPFHGIATRTNSIWGQHILQLLLVLLVYGFTLGFAARFIRVHA
jgi:hypothetical protein